MSGIGAVRAWEHPGFTPIDEQVSVTLAADSWLVEDGRILALERHGQRFADAVRDSGGDPGDALAATEAAAQLVPGAGRWSPRLDLTPAGIRLRIRPAPQSTDTVTVATAARDPRTLPLRKGPDLAALAVLEREETDRAGTPVEPIITVDGFVAEGTWSALLWWRGDALCTPDAGIPRLGSVTAAVLAEVARTEGIELRAELARPDDLDGCEIWLANALRGIRSVTRWVGGPRVGDAARASGWQSRLDRLRSAPSEMRR